MEQIPEEQRCGEGTTLLPQPRKFSLESVQQRKLSPAPRLGLAPRPRKMSFPSTSLSHHHLHALDFPEAARRYRRFSNVSDAVSRKLSTTLGWRTVSVQEVVTQAKSLCGQHIRAWLKRRGLFSRKLGLQRLRSVASLPGGLAVVDVFVQLEALSLELERKHGKLYTGVCRQMGVAVGTEKAICKSLGSMAHNMFKKDITWFKVASFYNLVSGAAVDCVRQGHPEYLYGLVEAAGLVIERDVASWIANQGGWVAILSKYRTPQNDSVFQVIALSVVGLVVVLLAMVMLIRSLGTMILHQTGT